MKYIKQSAKNAFKQYLTTIREQLLVLFPVADDNTKAIYGLSFFTLKNTDNTNIKSDIIDITKSLWL